MIPEAGLLAAAYLVGTIPFGVVAARLVSDVDLRRAGSGNIGATNVLRVVGKGAAVLTLVGDIGKGALAVGVARWAGASAGVVAGVALAAVLGHVFPVWTRLHGGKGVATTLGVVLAAMPAVGVSLLGIWLVVAGITRYSSLAALVATGMMAPLAWRLDGRPAMLWLAGGLLVLIVARHRENIRRLVAGTEGKIGQKAHPPASADHAGTG